MKNDYINGKNFLKNQRLFQELCGIAPKKFLLPLMKIRESSGLPKIKDINTAYDVLGDNPTENEFDKLLIIISECKTNRKSFFSIFNENPEKRHINRSINKILTDNNLGTEWKNPLIDLMISGFLMPPIYNLDIQPNRMQGKLILELNSRTSLKDIEDAWNSIENEQINVFGKVPKRNLSNKSVDNLINYVKMKKIKKRNPKLNTTDIVGRLNPNSGNESPSDTEDRKDANNLRQIKSRFNKRL